MYSTDEGVCRVRKQNDISIALIDTTGAVPRTPDERTDSLQEQFSCFDNSTQFEYCHQYSLLGTSDYLNFLPRHKQKPNLFCLPINLATRFWQVCAYLL